MVKKKIKLRKLKPKAARAALPQKAASPSADSLNSDGLNPLQAKYLNALLDGKKPVEAHRFVGVARQTANRWSKLPEFEKALAAGRLKMEEASVCSRLDVMRELWKVGGQDHRLLLDPANNTVLPSSEWPDKIGPAVAGVDIVAMFEGHGEARRSVGEIQKIRLHSKVDALKELNKMLGYNVAPKEPVGPDGKPVATRTRVILIPAKRTEAEMESYGRPITEAERPPPLPEEATPAPKRSLRDALKRVKK